jgi:hypothetical protein
MFPTDDLLRTLMSDREREIQERIRVRQLTGPRHSIIRWRSGPSSLGRQTQKRDL